MKELDFNYDLWANQAWLTVLPQFPDPAPAKKVMVHMLYAQWVWLRRCVVATGTKINVPEEPLEPSEAAFQLFHQAWTTLLSNADPQTAITYSRSDGPQFQNTLQEISLQVLNHGTYHRGQLRALAESAAIDFPETDLIRYLRETKP